MHITLAQNKQHTGGSFARMRQPANPHHFSGYTEFVRMNPTTTYFRG